MAAPGGFVGLSGWGADRLPSAAMALPRASRARLRRALPQSLRGGYARAVFAAPAGPDGAPSERPEQVLEGVETVDEAAIEGLLAAIERAYVDGLTRVTIVVDVTRRLTFDARHGHIRARNLDEATARKVMGGKERTFRPDESAAFLRVIGIMNADGTISTRHARKYKQVGHLAELCRPAWERIAGERPITAEAPLRVLDLACGNAYLSFVLAEALRLRAVPLRLHGVDVRGELVERARERARALSMAHLTFSEASIADALAEARAQLGGPPELVLALHACDVATDEALELAILAGAPSILAVPCCQRELAAQLANGEPSAAPTPALGRHGLLRGAYAATLTDGLRVDLLEACGYAVDVVEFVDSEHSHKNLLLRAHRRSPKAPVDPRRWRLDAIRATCARLGVAPSLLRRLEAAASTDEAR